ncbi:conserved exported hypothetical protein [Tenacibaculum litopenaei]|uniref:sensor histidine kinase n=1 Tax=Tenacibaculum litopenaei TaxID=396016 RepID=UPI0038941D00
MNTAFKLFFVFTVITSACFAQSTEKTIDSLHTEYEKWKHNNYKKSSQIVQQSYKLSILSKNDSLIFLSLYNKLDNLFKKKQIKKVNKSLDSLRLLAEKTKIPKHLASYLELNANVKRRLSLYDDALSSSLKAEKIAKSYNLSFLEHKIMLNRSFIHRVTKGKKYTIQYLSNLLGNPKYTDTYLKACTYNILGGLHNKNYKEHEKNKLKALELVKKLNVLDLKLSIYSSYGDFLLKTKRFNEGFKFLKSAKKIAHELNYETKLFYIYASIADYHYDLKNYPKCIENYTIAFNKYGEYVPDDTKAYSYWVLADAYYFNRQFEKSYIYQEKVIYLRDSIFNRERSEITQRLTTEYEVERKNSKIALLQKEKDLERQRRNTAIIGGSLLLIPLLLLVFFYRYRMRIQKTIKEQADQLHEQEIAQLQQEQKIKRIEGYIEGEEKEKNRIALELHDGIGGQLAGIQHLANHLSSDKNAEQLSKDLQQVARNVRLLSHSLSYNYSKHQSFPDLLQLLKEQYSNHFTLEASIYPQNRLSELNDRQKHFLYRCTQELVTNIYKHAKATEVSLSISIDHQITLVVEDDGIGFNTEAHNKGIGLLNIQERVANLEGTLHIDSHPQRGTTVIIEIPN